MSVMTSGSMRALSRALDTAAQRQRAETSIAKKLRVGTSYVTVFYSMSETCVGVTRRQQFTEYQREIGVCEAKSLDSA